MWSLHTKVTIARCCVVLQTAIAALCLSATVSKPIFSLRSDALNSSITQSLWTTSIYTPIAEKHIPVEVFLGDCHNLALAFKAAQVITLIGIAALVLTFLLALLQMAQSIPSRSDRSASTLCGVMICILFSISIISLRINFLIVSAMYDVDWCTNESSPQAAAVSLLAAAHMPRSMAAPTDTIPGLSGGCNPFDGCVESYRKMGFKVAEGSQLMQYTFFLAVSGLLVEFMTLLWNRSQTMEAGVGEMVALRRDDDERLL
ncbi:hypothetical protein JKF63_07886 [Porcisia hertigi]|uniref:Uncharacterized protein n=1 Tax=Porcisia hertigi TaxID=2761500 RepID=A0A836LJU1_9TRYP|nr:hypothetical protein JKF63_07886 [Porcisia hertigi]